MLLFLLFLSLLAKGAVQEFGDIQQLMGFAFGKHRRVFDLLIVSTCEYTK